MPAASITINGVTGSNTDLPINVVVNLNNNNVGDEATWAWTIVDKPTGSVAALVNPTLTNPTLTPDVEGTYLIQLVVDAGLAGEATNKVVASVRQLKSNRRIPAASETVEASASRGWATTTNALLRSLDDVSHTRVEYTASAVNAFALGDLAYPSSSAVIKTGLPGQETIPAVADALATSATITASRPIGMILRRADEGAGAIVATTLVVVLRHGLAPFDIVGAPAVGDPVYMSDTGTVSLTPGTYTRAIGYVVSAGGGFYQMQFEGDNSLGASAPTEANYLTDGASAELTNERNINAIVAPGLSFTTTDAAVTPMTVVANAAPAVGPLIVKLGATQVLQVDNTGDLDVDADIKISGRSNLFDGPGGVVQSLTKSTNGDLTIGTAATGNFILHGGGIDAWQVNGTTKTLEAIGATRFVSNVTDPALAQDAATKAYVDARIGACTLYWAAERGDATNGGDWYLMPGYIAGAAPTSTTGPIVAPYNGTLSHMYIVAGNPATGAACNVVFTVYVNGVATAITATVTGGTTTANDVAHTAAVTAGQLIWVEATNGATVTSALTDNVCAGVKFTAS